VSQVPFLPWLKLKNIFNMTKIFLTLGILLVLATNASSSDETQSIASKPDGMVTSAQEKAEKSEDVDRIYSDDEVFLTDSGYKIVPGYIPNWFWADATPLSASESATLDRMFGPSKPDNAPEWYWANGKPLSASENTDMPGPLNFPEWIQKEDPLSLSPKKKSKEKRAKDEIFILADHVKQNTKKEIIWAWGRVKIRLENKTQ
jgi:hypothetical protein